MLQKLIKYFTSHPKSLFLTDGIGALVSSFALGIVLVHFQNDFGLPILVLYILASIALVLAIYSISCYFKVNKNTRFFLKVIAIANLTYSLLTLGMVSYFFENLTLLGLIYFGLELLIIGILIFLEFSVALEQDLQ